MFVTRTEWVTDPTTSTVSHASIGRDDLLQSCEQALARGINLIVTGPAGVGKTAIVSELLNSCASRGDLALSCTALRLGAPIPGAILTELKSRLPASVLNQLTQEQRDIISAGAKHDPVTSAGAWAAAMRLCCTGGRSTLLTIDNVADADEHSVQVLAIVLQRCSDLPLRVVLAARRMPPAVVRVAPQPAQHIEVPPLSSDAVATLLERYGLPAKAAGPLHVDSGGNPSLLIALAGAMSHRHLTVSAPDALSPMVAALVHDRLDGLDDDAKHTLQLCALAAHPTLTLLERSGRVNAADEIGRSVDCGVIIRSDDQIQFTPSSAARVVLTELTGEERLRLHKVLADAVTTPEERLRHLALANPSPDSDFARSLADAGATAKLRGDFSLAAELYMLAADRSTVDADQPRSEWLVTAANLAASTGQEHMAQLARDRALADSSSAAQRVMARMSAVRMAGHNTASMQQALATALEDAKQDPESQASVLLWQACSAMLSGNLPEAIRAGNAAAEQAHSVDQTQTAATSLAIVASATRTSNLPGYQEIIAKALSLEGEPAADSVHLSAAYFNARFQMYDDRNDEAAATMGRLLALAERAGPEERVAVMRAILELDIRRGRCGHVLGAARQLTDAAARNGLSPGPVWYVSSVAELAAGSVVRATAYAAQGVRACEQDRDVAFLRHNLSALGQAHSRAGRPAEAVEVLQQLREMDARYGLKDPTSTRYHSDLVAALVALDRVDEAKAVLSECRAMLANHLGHRSVEAGLLRSEALLSTHLGNYDEAEAKAEEATMVFSDLGLSLEQGHTLLVHGQVARQRRRYAAARGHVQTAESLFRDAAARAWLAQCGTFRSHLDGHASDRSAVSGTPPMTGAAAQLTEAELRISRLVARGATNKEISQRLYLSVKTVEATLTRVYRKVGVRSRTQLGAQLGFHSDQQ